MCGCCHRFILWAIHHGYCHVCGYCHCLYHTTICVGNFFTSCCMLCTAGTATCMSTAMCACTPLIESPHEPLYYHYITLCTAHVWHLIMMNNIHWHCISLNACVTYVPVIYYYVYMICCLHGVYIHSSVHACRSSLILTTSLHA